jgi:cell wall-associated NlpC family hydrolase
MGHGLWALGFALWLVAALGGAACAARGGVPKPFPGAPTPTAPPISAPSTRPEPAGASPIATALSLLGAPYRNGGSDPTGFDCSGFVQWVFGRHGTTLPREVREQYAKGQPVSRGDVRPGDLLFFETVGPGATHVGIALGGGEFVHAPSSRGVVRIERATSDYWSRRWVGARRVG